MFQRLQECAGSFAWTSDARVLLVVARANQVDRTCDFSDWNDMSTWLKQSSLLPQPPPRGKQSDSLWQPLNTFRQKESRLPCWYKHFNGPAAQSKHSSATACLVQMSSTADVPSTGLGWSLHLSDSSKLRVFSLQRITKVYCACALLLTQSCCGKASKNVPVWRWGSSSLTSTRHWNHYEISSETDSSQFSRLVFITLAFKNTAKVTLTNWFQISIVKHCIMSLLWISPETGLLS